jgi:hypothetical protein
MLDASAACGRGMGRTTGRMWVWLAVRVTVALMVISSAAGWAGRLAAAVAAAPGLIGAHGLGVVQMQERRVHEVQLATGRGSRPSRWQASRGWRSGPLRVRAATAGGTASRTRSRNAEEPPERRAPVAPSAVLTGRGTFRRRVPLRPSDQRGVGGRLGEGKESGRSWRSRVAPRLCEVGYSASVPDRAVRLRSYG